MKLDDAGNDQQHVEHQSIEHLIPNVKHEIQYTLNSDHKLLEFYLNICLITLDPLKQ